MFNLCFPGILKMRLKMMKKRKKEDEKKENKIFNLKFRSDSCF